MPRLLQQYHLYIVKTPERERLKIVLEIPLLRGKAVEYLALLALLYEENVANVDNTYLLI